MNHTANRHARPRARTTRWRAVAGIALACTAAAGATAAIIAAISGGPHPLSLGQQKHQQGTNAGLALDTAGHSGGQPVSLPVIKIGLTATPGDATALVGVRLGYYTQAIGGHFTFDPVIYPSVSAEASALETGKIQAAYITAASTVEVWQASDHRIRIVAGATASHGGTGTVLAMTTQFLTTHAAQASDVLEGHIRATMLLATNRDQASSAVRAEFITLTHDPPAKQLRRALSAESFTNAPDIAGVGGHVSVGSPPTGLFDLQPLNVLLRADGQTPVSA